MQPVNPKHALYVGSFCCNNSYYLQQCTSAHCTKCFLHLYAVKVNYNPTQCICTLPTLFRLHAGLGGEPRLIPPHELQFWRVESSVRTNKTLCVVLDEAVMSNNSPDTHPSLFPHLCMMFRCHSSQSCRCSHRNHSYLYRTHCVSRDACQNCIHRRLRRGGH